MTRPAFPFLSPVEPACPPGLLSRAQTLPPPRVAVVNAGAVNPMQGIREAAELGLAEPILIGDPAKIRAIADEIGWDLQDLRIEEAPMEAAAPRAAALARAGEADAIMKGQIHTSTFLKGLLPSAAGLRAPGARCGHIFHITAPGAERPLLLTDAALNVDPDIETRQACLAHAVALSRQLGTDRPRAAILSATEDPIASLPNSVEAVEIAAWAQTALPGADVAGPMALDLAFSRQAALDKGYDSPVAGDADILLTPNITTGNAVFKLMVLGMGCCAAGIVLGARVPILLTSRSQKAGARIATAALGAIAATAGSDATDALTGGGPLTAAGRDAGQDFGQNLARSARR
ncbi:phosphate acetyltransferase [Mesobaculum littorinae]|uniref:Phosphate acetyltransferase n=1 Tax=Mesobaculum littorinae TaxID=2486419 RepID=A0A438AJ27_9RHOB|nr:phosphate acyltransferase [Mesobaculum littorinae]RVV98710.1 phosphate acetyltransferase [Mesobaculum littorinae]